MAVDGVSLTVAALDGPRFSVALVPHTLGVTPHRIEWYPGARHGFAFPQREGIYDKASAERHWERLFGLFGRVLG